MRRGCRFAECESDPTRFSISFPMDYPRLSIVCLAYNAAAYIRQVLYGFLMQKTRFPSVPPGKATRIALWKPLSIRLIPSHVNCGGSHVFLI